ESRIDAKLTPLAVSAPFHSRMMQPIEERFRAVLQSASWGDASAVLSNFTGTWHDSPQESLVRQISGRVRWVDNMRALEGMRVVEVGPSRPLRAFFRAMGVTIDSVTNVTTAERLAPSVPRRGRAAVACPRAP